MSYKIRPPKLEDYDQFNKLGKWFQENSNFKSCGWCEKKIKLFISLGGDPNSDIFLRLVEKDNQVVGFFLGYSGEYFFSEKIIASELAVFFDEGHRTNIAGSIVRMIKQFEDWAKERNAHEIQLGISSGIAGKGYRNLIERRGLKEVGQIFKKEV